MKKKEEQEQFIENEIKQLLEILENQKRFRKIIEQNKKRLRKTKKEYCQLKAKNKDFKSEYNKVFADLDWEVYTKANPRKIKKDLLFYKLFEKKTK